MLARGETVIVREGAVPCWRIEFARKPVPRAVRVLMSWGGCGEGG